MFCRALGDAFSQKIEGAKQVDLKRSLMTSVYGAAFIGEEALAFICIIVRVLPSNGICSSMIGSKMRCILWQSLRHFPG